MKLLKNLLGASLILVFFSLVAISCSGGDSDSNKLTAETKITGPLGKYFEVVDKNYKIVSSGSSVKIAIQIKRVSEGGPQNVSWNSRPTFKIDIMDSDDDVVATDDTDVVFDEKELSAIFALSVGESATLTFKFNEEIVEKASKLKVSSSWEADKEKEDTSEVISSDDSESDESSSSSSSSSDDDDNSNFTSSSSSSSSGSTDSCFPHSLICKKMSLENQQYSAKNLVNCGAHCGKQEPTTGLDT